jgi:hypothetical protein
MQVESESARAVAGVAEGPSGCAAALPAAPAAAEERVQVSHHIGACVHQ